MANVGVFDVLGPIMIGPSSSHTAGAALRCPCWPGRTGASL